MNIVRRFMRSFLKIENIVPYIICSITCIILSDEISSWLGINSCIERKLFVEKLVYYYYISRIYYRKPIGIENGSCKKSLISIQIWCLIQIYKSLNMIYVIMWRYICIVYKITQHFVVYVFSTTYIKLSR